MRYFLITAFAALSITKALAQPEYNDVGEMLAPGNYERWVFVGSNLGLAYKEEESTTTAREAARAGLGVFHNVYMETEAYLHFMTKGEFRDPTQFIFEVYSAGTKDSGGVLNEGEFNDQMLVAEMAVKDSKRPKFEGSTEIWAYYQFELDNGALQSSARAMPDSACFDCHIQHAGFDNFWVQFYPRLRQRLNPN